MELSQHIIRKGGEGLKQLDPDACIAELKEEFATWKGSQCLLDLVTPENVEKTAPYIRSLRNSGLETWLRLRSVIDYITQPGNLYKSERTMCGELGINYNTWYGWSRAKSAWKFINLIVVESTDAEYEGKVHRAVADGALNGTHQDKRLYLELTKKINRAGVQRSHGAVNVIFIQDTMQRPQIAESSAIEASIIDEE